jgi:membrane associated rhomboid family serine protease
MAYSEKEYKKNLTLGQSNNALVLLIAINLIVFVIFAFMRAVYHLRTPDNDEANLLFQQNVLDWFALPADISTIGERPWTILTHMFLHENVWDILGNMLWLWVFGYILQDLTGNRKIFPLFLYGSLAGATGFVLACNFLPALQPYTSEATTMGAAAGIMAIAVAATVISPSYRIFPMLNGGIPIWILTGIYIIIDLTTIADGNRGGHIAHLSGALIGFLFIYFYQKGYDWGGWMNNFFDWVNNLFNPDKPKKNKPLKQELFYKSTAKPYTKTPNVTEQRVDEILDKINQKGYNSLTEEEKELLKRASQENL